MKDYGATGLGVAMPTGHCLVRYGKAPEGVEYVAPERSWNRHPLREADCQAESRLQ